MGQAFLGLKCKAFSPENVALRKFSDGFDRKLENICDGNMGYIEHKYLETYSAKN